MKKMISVVTPGYNEAENIRELHGRIRAIAATHSEFDFEHIYIDNASTDGSLEVLREIAARDRSFKVIVNSRNFGHVRSPHHGLLVARGDAVVLLASDLQDPPELISKFIEEWRRGVPIVLGVRSSSDEGVFMRSLRRLYYKLVEQISETPLISNFTGFGLYDRAIIGHIRQFKDAYPYFRGAIAEVGFERREISFHQIKRKGGRSKNNIFRLYDFAMLGFVNHSKVPLRLSAFAGFLCAMISIVVAMFYLVYKLMYWDEFKVGIAPLVVGLFFFSSVQLFFLGVVGEYVGAIYTQAKGRPLVIEKERINFE